MGDKTAFTTPIVVDSCVAVMRISVVKTVHESRARVGTDSLYLATEDSHHHICHTHTAPVSLTIMYISHKHYYYYRQQDRDGSAFFDANAAP